MRRASLLAAVLAAAAWLAPRHADACAACGNPSLPQLPTGTGSTRAGQLTLRLSLQGTALSVSHPAGCADLTDCAEVPVQPAHTHDVLAVPLELRPTLGWSVTEVVGLELELPLRMVHTAASYETPDGAPYEPIDEGNHHRDETIVGLADAQLRGRATAVLGAWWLTFRLGTSIPLGSTEPDPFAAGEAGERHQHIQLGTGTFDPSFGVDVTRGLPRSQWSLYGTVQASLYENQHGFRSAPRGLVGISGVWKVRPELLPYASLEGAFEGGERWSGVVRQDGLIGRHELRLGLGIRWKAGATTFDAALRFPLYRHLVEGEEPAGDLVSPVSASISAGWTWGDI